MINQNLGLIQDIKDKFNTVEMYNVFSNCIYMPTWEKFILLATEYVSDEAINIFSYYEGNLIVGIIVIKQNSRELSEIKGIAVDSRYRNQGIGKNLIKFACDELSLSVLTAETDDDAVNFYKKVGFEINAFYRKNENGKYKRYNCILTYK